MRYTGVRSRGFTRIAAIERDLVKWPPACLPTVMSDSKRLSRRSFISRVAGAAAATGALAVVGGCAATPGTPGYTGLTDNDGGPNQDRENMGRGSRSYSGITDSDSGYYQDAAGNGRGTQRQGSSGPTGLNDVDISDPAGNGRRGGGTGYKPSRCSDSDSRGTTGRTDPQGHGTRCN